MVCTISMYYNPHTPNMTFHLVSHRFRYLHPFVFILILFTFFPSSSQGQSEQITYFQKNVEKFPLTDERIPDVTFFDSLIVNEPWSHWEKGPVEGLSFGDRTEDGVVWLKSDRGAARFDTRATHLWDRWQYFAGEAWLPHDEVEAIYIDKSSTHETAWLKTAEGYSKISSIPYTLEKKADHYDQLVEKYHIRKGFVARSVLTTAGNIETATHSDTDNDGLWTAMYIAAQAYRFAVTGAEDARDKAQRGLKALMKLETIDPIPGFYARTYRTYDEPLPHKDNGEWHPVGDGKTEWKGDTSSDETVGHYYGYALYFDLVADETERDSIRKYIRRITDYMIDNDYELLDIDGLPTRWGRWSEAYYDSREGDYEKALRSAEILSFLKTAYHITGDRKYQEAYEDRIQRGYAHYTLEYRRWGSKDWEVNFSDDELYYLSIFPLLMYEEDPVLRSIYMDGLRFAWAQVQPESNALWNYMSAALEAGPLTPELQANSRRTLERSPMSLIRWGMQNSHRIDVRIHQSADRHGRGFLVRVVAPDERPLHKHYGNPYQADSHSDGREMMAPTYWLLPYWMGRYYGWL